MVNWWLQPNVRMVFVLNIFIARSIYFSVMSVINVWMKSTLYFIMSLINVMFIWLLNEYLEHFLVCLVYYCLLTLFYHKRSSSFVSVLHLFFCLVFCFLCLDFNIMFDSTRSLSRTLMVHLWYASSIMANQNDCSLRFLNTYVNCKMFVVTNYFPKTINNISSFLEPWHLASLFFFYTHFVLSKGFHIQSILKKYIEKRSRIFMRVN